MNEMVDHLKKARFYARGADSIGDVVETAQLSAQLAIAHALIAIVERMDKVARDAEVAAERADLIRERLAQQRASERIL